MSLNFNGNYIGGIPSGGGGGTTDHAELTNLDYANSGHTGFMSNENYIPSGTVINVKLDGTGDFTSLNDACEYIKGKYSDGVVTIKLGSGTFIEDSMITITQDNFNFGGLVIKGNGTDSTIVQFSQKGYGVIRIYGGFITIEDIDFYFPQMDTTNTNHIGFLIGYGANTTLRRTSIRHAGIGLYTMFMAKITIDKGLNIEDGKIGISCNQSQIASSSNLTITMKNLTTGFSVGNAGFINFWNATPTFTNVTNKTSKAVGTLTADGWITGITV